VFAREGKSVHSDLRGTASGCRAKGSPYLYTFAKRVRNDAKKGARGNGLFTRGSEKQSKLKGIRRLSHAWLLPLAFKCHAPHLARRFPSRFFELAMGMGLFSRVA